MLTLSGVLALLPNESIKAKFDKPFELAYVVTLAEHQLSTDLHVKNISAGTDTLEFQALFHTYIRAPANDVLVTPLQGVNFYDKTEPTDELKAQAKVETRPAVDVKKFTDSVYENAGGKYEVIWPGGGVEIKTRNLKDVVVWNPQEEGAKIGDMETGGWYVCIHWYFTAHCADYVFREKYVCVEPGYVRGFVTLARGETWVGQQVITATDGSTSTAARA